MLLSYDQDLTLAHLPCQAAHPENTVFAVVRNADTSTHLVDFLAGGERKNVHVLEGDIIDPAATKASCYVESTIMSLST